MVKTLIICVTIAIRWVKINQINTWQKHKFYNNKLVKLILSNNSVRISLNATMLTSLSTIKDYLQVHFILQCPLTLKCPQDDICLAILKKLRECNGLLFVRVKEWALNDFSRTENFFYINEINGNTISQCKELKIPIILRTNVSHYHHLPHAWESLKHKVTLRIGDLDFVRVESHVSLRNDTIEFLINS